MTRPDLTEDSLEVRLLAAAMECDPGHALVVLRSDTPEFWTRVSTYVQTLIAAAQKEARDEAAARIEALEAENKRLREALELWAPIPKADSCSSLQGNS